MFTCVGLEPVMRAASVASGGGGGTSGNNIQDSQPVRPAESSSSSEQGGRCVLISASLSVGPTRPSSSLGCVT